MKNRFIKLMGLVLVFVLGLTLLGCSDTPAPVEQIAPETIEIYVDENNKNIYNVGETFNLAIDVDPSNASYDVEWKSNNTKIATVDENGVVTIVGSGDFKITATSKVDKNVKDSISKKAYDNTNDLKDIQDTKDYLDYLMPEGYAVNGVLELPREYSNSTITWTSSNSSVLSTDGLYTRQDKDVSVKLTANIRCGQTTDKWTRDIVIGNKNDAPKKTLNSGHIVMMYTYTKHSSYTAYELQNIDIVNHSFALINTSTHELELGGISGSASNILKAQSYGVRVCLSIGGWGADGFSQACETEETRAVFINSIIKAVTKYGYDGVDLDWEYPTSKSAGIAATSKDKANFTSLCKELREALNKLGGNKLLTIAVASGTSYYNVREVDKYVDYWNIMTYDYSEKSAGSSARYDDPLNRSKQAIESYISSGATANKIILGITFRAVKYKVESLGSNFGFGEKMMASREDVDYSDLGKYLNDPSYIKGFDSNNGMGYIYSLSKVNGYYEILAYDDESTLNAKGAYIRQKGIGGIMSWELGMDDANNTALKLTVKAVK